MSYALEIGAKKISGIKKVVLTSIAPNNIELYLLPVGIKTFVRAFYIVCLVTICDKMF